MYLWIADARCNGLPQAAPRPRYRRPSSRGPCSPTTTLRRSPALNSLPLSVRSTSPSGSYSYRRSPARRAQLRRLRRNSGGLKSQRSVVARPVVADHRAVRPEASSKCRPQASPFRSAGRFNVSTRAARDRRKPLCTTRRSTTARHRPATPRSSRRCRWHRRRSVRSRRSRARRRSRQSIRPLQSIRSRQSITFGQRLDRHLRPSANRQHIR